MVTVLLLNYKRQENIPVIIDTLRSQTIPCEIFMWNNAEEPFADARVDWVINSTRNVKCWPRWFMAQYASNEFVMSLDDDLNFSDSKCLEILVDQVKEHYVEGRVFGLFGVQLNDAGVYQPTKRDKKLNRWGIPKKMNKHLEYPKENTLVDIVKGRCFICHKNDLAKATLRPEYTDICDDITLSAILANGRKRHHMLISQLNGKMMNMEGAQGEMALSQMGNWNETRTNVVNFYFKG